MSPRAPAASLEDVRVGLPPGLRLAAPYNHDPALLDALEPVAGHLAGVYLPVHPTAAASGRAFRGPAAPAAYVAELRRVARRCRRMGLGLALLANVPGWAVDARAVARTAETLRGEVDPLRVTLADLAAARRVRAAAPWLAIGVSTLADVRTPVEACWWRDEVGAAFLTVSREVNRTPAALARLAATGMRLGVVSYDDCVPGCQYRLAHVVPERPGGRRRGWTTSPRCLAGASRRARPWLLAQKEILPGHLRHLAGLVEEVKVSGRDQETPEVLRRLRLYLEARSLDHPSDLYAEPRAAWKRIASCDRACRDCSWCADHLRPLAPVFAGDDDAGPRDAPGRPTLDLRGPHGARIRATLGPIHPDRPPLREVCGMGLYCRVDGVVDGVVVEAVLGRIADRLQAAGGDVVRGLAAAASGSLPGGFRRG
ncbi:MAG: hypothetical protein HY907_10670 [Deltaproteobacteria bacterium]|nr:hypothetical protein [Deltaproteobacteria bacterium]